MAKSNAEDYLEKEVDKIKHKDDMTTAACKKMQKELSLPALTNSTDRSEAALRCFNCKAFTFSPPV